MEHDGDEAAAVHDGVVWRVAGMCQYGLVTPGPAPDLKPMPAKMPTRCVVLEELPLTANGKVDTRRAVLALTKETP